MILPTQDPFASIGVQQDEFCRNTAAHGLHEGADRDSVETMTALAVRPGLSSDSLPAEESCLRICLLLCPQRRGG